uniref:Uncharacterized protein n=1 Tax=Knipowitschia caucasica TaxID=637954 RepID=A0AAV2J700_KNICA
MKQRLTECEATSSPPLIALLFVYLSPPSTCRDEDVLHLSPPLDTPLLCPSSHLLAAQMKNDRFTLPPLSLALSLLTSFTAEMTNVTLHSTTSPILCSCLLSPTFNCRKKSSLLSPLLFSSQPPHCKMKCDLPLTHLSSALSPLNLLQLQR